MIRNLWRNSILRSSLTLISGTVLTQAIAFLCSPVLTRVFTATDFGNLANYNAWVSILALAGCLRYEQAIPIATNRSSAQRILALTAALSVGSFVLYTAIGLVIHFTNPGAGYLKAINGFILIIPLGVLLASLSSILIQVNVRAGRFKRLAVAAVVQVIGTLIWQIVLGLSQVSDALMWGNVAGWFLAALLLTGLSIRAGDFAGLRASLAHARLANVGRAYANFPRYSLPADLIAVVTQQFTPVFILALFSPALAGLYAFGLRIVRVPLLVISTAINAALRKHGVDHLASEGNLQSLFTGILWPLLVLGLIPFAMIALAGGWLFGAVFGPGWVAAGHVVQILSPGILLEFVALPLSVFFIITNNQRYMFVIQLCGFAALVGALVVGKYYFNDLLDTCYLLSAVMVLVNGASIVLSRKVADRRRPSPKPGSSDTGSPVWVEAEVRVS